MVQYMVHNNEKLGTFFSSEIMIDKNDHSVSAASCVLISSPSNFISSFYVSLILDGLKQGIQI